MLNFFYFPNLFIKVCGSAIKYANTGYLYNEVIASTSFVNSVKSYNALLLVRIKTMAYKKYPSIILVLGKWLRCYIPHGSHNNIIINII